MRRLLRLALLGYLVASLAAGVVLGEFAVHRGRLGAPRVALDRATGVAAAHGAAIEPVRISAADGVALSGWMFARPAGTSRGTVLVLHGSYGTRDHATPYAAFLLDAGFDVLAPDARGHGESGGFGTYGVLEADDVQRWAAWARSRHPHQCVYAVGSSMGAAQVLLAEAEARQPTFCAIVADSSFATFLDAGLDRIGGRLGGEVGRWLGRPAAYVGAGYVRLRYGVNLLDANPGAAIERIHTPVLLIHGDADRNTPVYHARALAAAQPAATLWIVHGAAHTAAWRAEPEAFPRRIVAFLRQHG